MNFIKDFIIGGLIVSGTALLTQKIGTSAAAIFYSLPLLRIATLLALKSNNVSNQILIELMQKTSILFVNAILLLIAFHVSLKYFDSYGYQNAFYLALLMALLSWILSTYMINKFIINNLY